jgi:hypothetical protein
LLTDGDEFPHQVTKATVFSELRPGAFYRGTLGNHLGDRLSTDAMSQGIRRTMSRGIFLGAVAVGLATLTETRGQNTRTQIVDAGQTSGELIAFIPQCF